MFVRKHCFEANFHWSFFSGKGGSPPLPTVPLSGLDQWLKFLNPSLWMFIWCIHSVMNGLTMDMKLLVVDVWSDPGAKICKSYLWTLASSRHKWENYRWMEEQRADCNLAECNLLISARSWQLCTLAPPGRRLYSLLNYLSNAFSYCLSNLGIRCQKTHSGMLPTPALLWNCD